MRTLFLAATVSLACTFDGGPRSTAAGQPPEPGKSDDPATSGTSGGPSTEGTGSSAEPTPDPGGEATQSTSSDVTSEGNEESSTSSMPSSTGEPPGVDCLEPITLTQHAPDADLSPPMMLGEHLGTAYAFSDVQGAGEIRFTFEVACPSIYRVFGRVRDDDPSTHSCCDPDSFEVRAPGGVNTSWFYGCDTEQSGFSWVPVKSGSGVASCAEPTVLMVPLSVGSHEIVLRNREPVFGSARAGVASLTLTNDPAYTPG